MNPVEEQRFLRELHNDFNAPPRSSWCETLIIIAFLLLLIFLACAALGAVVGDPYTGTPIKVCGDFGCFTNWRAADYDKGGEGVAFHDPHGCGASAGAGCSCAQTYRPDGVNVCTIAFNNTNYFSYTDAGLWVQYTVQATAPEAWYAMDLLIAFADAACCGAAAYHIEIDSVPVGKSVPLGPAVTGGWEAFEWRGRSEMFPLNAGIHDLRIVVDKGWFNLNAVRLQYVRDTVPIWNGYNWAPIIRVWPPQ